jgi:TonB family protein
LYEFTPLMRRPPVARLSNYTGFFRPNSSYQRHLEDYCSLTRTAPTTYLAGTALALSALGVFCCEELMKLRIMQLGLGLILLLGVSTAVIRTASAQDTTADESKRKVRVKVAPDYPPLAKQLNVTGKVKIEATIAADGHVSGTKVVGGSPLLINASLDALKKWRFEPAPKETTEVIEFEFNGQ